MQNMISKNSGCDDLSGDCAGGDCGGGDIYDDRGGATGGGLVPGFR